jgi:hypothetical protein
VTRRGRRLVLAALVVAAVALTGAPAAAHGGATGGEYRSTVTGLSQYVEGVDLDVAEHASADGTLLTVTNGSGVPLVVLGDDDEEFLRLTGDGAWLNLASATGQRVAGAQLVGHGRTPEAQPAWEQVAARGRYAWLDVRVGWHSDSPPTEVLAAPRERRLVAHWHVPVRAGSRELSIDGETWWEPEHYSAALTMAFCLGLLALFLGGAVALVWPRRTSPESTAAV